MAKEIKFPKCYLVARPRQYNVNGVTFTVTPVYDGKQGVDIKKQFEKCVLRVGAMKPLPESFKKTKCLYQWHIGNLKFLAEAVRKRRAIRTSGVKLP